MKRRTFLKALGAFASLPVGQVLFQSVARAQGVTSPLKFVGVYFPHGVASEFYARRASETETAFSLTFTDSSLAPFDTPASYGGRSFKNRLITFEGADLAVAETSSTPGHGAAVTLFTGSQAVGADHNPQCESMDQYLARTRGLGAGTRFPTLNVGVGSLGVANQDAIAHAVGGATIRNQVDPVAVFDQVFAGMTGSTDAAAAAAARRRGQSVIDFVRGDLNALNARLATPEKAKLDQHLSAIRDIETRLNAVSTMGCTVPARPTAFPAVAKYNGGEPYFDAIADLQIDLLALALSCDATRFATFFFDDPGKVMSVDGTSLPADVHNEVAHLYTQGGTDATAQASQLKLARLNRYYFGKIARLMQRLDEGGILDSTLILAGSDMGDPAAHSTRDIPLLLAGGTNGQLTMGRRLKATGTGLVPHNKVLVSVAKLFGDTSNTFGVATDPALITGGWAGL
ncbi:MAG: DUF1552 domain-containing protein [Myxococcota bacterium]